MVDDEEAMPHLILEYSANLPSPDLQSLFASLHEALAALGIELDDCKSRAYRCEAYRVGKGDPRFHTSLLERAFAHLTLAVLDSRPQALQHAAGEQLLRILSDAFATVVHDCDVTVEVRSMRTGGYFKTRHQAR
jgi:5-carboxymethyl-2-hydroxymuconate isomerase